MPTSTGPVYPDGMPIPPDPLLYQHIVAAGEALYGKQWKTKLGKAIKLSTMGMRRIRIGENIGDPNRPAAIRANLRALLEERASFIRKAIAEMPQDVDGLSEDMMTDLKRIAFGLNQLAEGVGLSTNHVALVGKGERRTRPKRLYAFRALLDARLHAVEHVLSQLN